MGTNYYLLERHCQHCERSDRRHIGKSSAGWCFSLHVYPEDGINSLDDWLPRLTANAIEDEYGRATSADDLLATIRERSWPKSTDTEGDPHAEHGPNNLLRHRVDGRHTIGHGPGTWDYIVGDFSNRLTPGTHEGGKMTTQREPIIVNHEDYRIEPDPKNPPHGYQVIGPTLSIPITWGNRANAERFLAAHLERVHESADFGFPVAPERLPLHMQKDRP